MLPMQRKTKSWLHHFAVEYKSSSFIVLKCLYNHSIVYPLCLRADQLIQKCN